MSKWKCVKDFPDYWISDKGVVLSRRTAKTLKLWQKKNGYQMVVFGVAGKQTIRNLAHVVLETFVGPKPAAEYVACHKNDIKSDNRLENLYWGTRSQNAKDAYVNGIFNSQGENNNFSKLTNEAVKKIRSLYPKYTYDTLGSIFNVHPTTVWRVVKKKSWVHV